MSCVVPAGISPGSPKATTGPGDHVVPVLYSMKSAISKPSVSTAPSFHTEITPEYRHVVSLTVQMSRVL